MFEQVKVRLTGLSPLLMHNGQLADPLNSWTKKMRAVTKKRTKTEDDHAEIARLEWHASLYVDDDGYPCMPGENVESCFIEGAKKSKLGKQFKSAVFVDTDCRVNYGGRKKAEELWGDDNYRDTRSVRVSTSRTMRTRPIFRKWEIDVPVHYDAELVDIESVLRAIADAGRQVGIGDFRPKFGRFEVEVIE